MSQGNALADDAKALIDKFGAIGGVSTSVPGGLHEEPLQDTPAGTPYASYTIRQGPHPNEYTSSGDWINYSELTLAVRGIGLVTVATAAGIVQAGLEAGDWAVPNASFMRLERLPGEETKIEEPPGTSKAGEDYRKHTLKYCLWTHRKA